MPENQKYLKYIFYLLYPTKSMTKFLIWYLHKYLYILHSFLNIINSINIYHLSMEIMLESFIQLIY